MDWRLKMKSEYRIRLMIEETIEQINDTHECIKNADVKDTQKLMLLSRQCIKLSSRLKTLREVLE